MTYTYTRKIHSLVVVILFILLIIIQLQSFLVCLDNKIILGVTYFLASSALMIEDCKFLISLNK